MWSFHKVDGTYLGQIPVDCQLHIGRTYNKSSIDLKISNIRVSRKQIFLKVEADKINCRVDGINPIYVYRRDINSISSSSSYNMIPTKYSKDDYFFIYHNELLEFNIFKKQNTIKIVICRSGLMSTFNFVFQNLQFSSSFLKRKKSKTFIDSTSPNKLRRVSSTLGLQHHSDDNDDSLDEERLSIVDKLGSKFSFEMVMNDPEHGAPGGSRIGDEYQAIIQKATNQTDQRESNNFEILRPKLNRSHEELKHKLIQNFDSSNRIELMNRLDDDYINGISIYEDYLNLRVWNDYEKQIFEEALYKFPKMFNLVGDYLAEKLKDTSKQFDRRACNAYFYTNFKGSNEYRVWKDSFFTKESGSAGVNMSFKIQAFLAEENQPVEPSDEEDEDNDDEFALNKRKKLKKKVNFPKRKGKRNHELLRLIEAGVLKPGPKALYLVYHGQKVEGELTPTGGILYNDRKFESASSWSFFAKKQMNPKVRSDNGWSSVHHDGRPLSYYRGLFDPGKTGSNSTAPSKPTLSLLKDFPSNVDDFKPTLELVPLAAVNLMLLDMQKNWILVVPSSITSFNVRSSKGAFFGHFGISENEVFSVHDENSSLRKFSSLFSWFKNRNPGHLDFFEDCEVLCFSDESSIKPCYKTIKQLYFDYNHKRINNVKEEESRKQKLLHGKRATSLRLNLLDRDEEIEVDRTKTENWSKYDRYCICRHKYIESNNEDWFMQCSKGSSYCHGWIHPKCFGLSITHEQSENIENFTCPLCSLDGIELAEMHGETLISSCFSQDQDSEMLTFKDTNTLKIFNSVERNNQVDKNNILRKRRVVYLPGTRIRLKKYENNKPVGWFLGEIDEQKENEGPLIYSIILKDTSETVTIDLEDSADFMLDKDWKKFGCFRLQDVHWRIENGKICEDL